MVRYGGVCLSLIFAATFAVSGGEEYKGRCAIYCAESGQTITEGVTCPVQPSDFDDHCPLATNDQTAASRREAESSLPASVEVAADQPQRRCEPVKPAAFVAPDAGGIRGSAQCFPIETKASPVLVTVKPHEQDFDLCIWENDEDWHQNDRYEDCHGHRHNPPAALHCRSSNGGTETDQVRISDDGAGLMACVVGYQGARGTYRFIAE